VGGVRHPQHTQISSTCASCWDLCSRMDLLICSKYSAILIRPDPQSLYNVRFEVAENLHLGCYIES
jgi:hypothetical protein